MAIRLRAITHLRTVTYGDPSGMFCIKLSFVSDPNAAYPKAPKLPNMQPQISIAVLSKAGKSVRCLALCSSGRTTVIPSIANVEIPKNRGNMFTLVWTFSQL